MKTLTKSVVSAAILAMSGVADLANAGLLLQAEYPAGSGGQAAGVDVKVDVQQAPLVKRLPRIQGRKVAVDLDLKLTSRIFQTESMPIDVSSVNGSGVSVTLDDAVRQIVPRGWSVFTDSEEALERTASWASDDKPWPYALDQVLLALNMEASIDWEHHSIEIFASRKPSKIAPAAPENPADLASPAAAAAVKLEPSKPAAAPVYRYTMRKGDRLSVAIEQLVKDAGWTSLKWNAYDQVKAKIVDYAIEEDVEFSGDILGKTGIIARVIGAYSDAERPLSVEFFGGNKVVEVRLKQRPSVDGSVLGADPARD